MSGPNWESFTTVTDTCRGAAKLAALSRRGAAALRCGLFAVWKAVFLTKLCCKGHIGKPLRGNKTSTAASRSAAMRPPWIHSSSRTPSFPSWGSASYPVFAVFFRFSIL